MDCCSLGNRLAILSPRRASYENLRVTIISPGVIATELGDDISDENAKDLLTGLRKSALTPDAIARAIGEAPVHQLG